MRRAYTLILLLSLSLSALAQSPEAIREMLKQGPHLATPTTATYPIVPLGEIAMAPEGFEPYYLSVVGRHGSRYHEDINKHILGPHSIYRKADSLGILTVKGKEVYEALSRVLSANTNREGELTDIGYQQWLGIAHRIYKNFTPIFASGTIGSKSSHVMRCVLSMLAYNQGIKECNPALGIVQNSRKSERPILLPLTDNPGTPRFVRALYKDYRKNGEWLEYRKAWDKQSDCSSFISKITTDRNRLLNECGGGSDLNVARQTLTPLNFAENFGDNNRELIASLFTPEEIYDIYVYTSVTWSNNTIGRGNEIVEMYASYVEPLIDDIMTHLVTAAEGNNKNHADHWFTHDSYVFPTLSIIGYEGCVPQYSTDIEHLATQINYSLQIPMAANLQVVLYRNEVGEVLVRSLINERDAYLPIECKTAPFYPWSDFKSLVEGNMKQLIDTRNRVLAKYKK